MVAIFLFLGCMALVFQFLIPKSMVDRSFVMFNAAMWRQNKRRCFRWCSSLHVFNSCGKYLVKVNSRQPMREINVFVHCVNNSCHSYHYLVQKPGSLPSLCLSHTCTHTKCLVLHFVIEMISKQVNA